MFVESVELNNYRNFDSAKAEFSPGINILFGDNAQGKTNLLESVYLSGTSRSHRASRDRDLIRFDQEEAHIRLIFSRDGLSHRIDVHLRRNNSKGIAVDGMPLKKAGELLGLLHVVFFSPEDLSIIKNSPSGRRKFMDMEMSQLDKAYMKMLILYHKALHERNNLLKQISVFPTLRETLDAWDSQLLELGQDIIRKREEFSGHMDELMRKIHGQLTGEEEIMQVRYEKNVEADSFKERLLGAREKDIRNGTTSVGPHRDDLSFLSNGIDLRRYGSQGQQRTAALSLKLSEIRLIEEISGQKPILLLDDVLSELDIHRQNWLLEGIQDIQTMITCTGLDEFVNRRISLDKIFFVHRGNISEYLEDK